MRIIKYGITLTRLKEKDIELVRTVRNSEKIQSQMEFRDYITPEMQKEWFDSINNKLNYYFVIEYENKKVGLINGKSSDLKEKTSEGGIFIWDEQYWGTALPVMCSVIMCDYTFYILKSHKVFVKTLKTNKKALSYVKRLGYVPTNEKKCGGNIQWLSLTKDNYEKAMRKLRKGIQIFTNDYSALSFDNFDFNDDNPEDIEKLYSNLPPHLQFEVDKKIGSLK